MLAMNIYTGGTISKVEDTSDLYEGGRNTLHQDSDDNEGGSRQSENDARLRKQTTTLINRQLALRRSLAAAKELEMSPSTQISRVKHPSSTTVKVSGLTNKVREKYLTAFADLLKANLLECGTDDPPEHKLVYRDFEDCGIEIEYKCFTTSKVLSLYQRKAVQEVCSI